MLAAVLVVAMVAPRWEAFTAVPAAGVVLALGLITPSDALHGAAELLPTLGFLAAILVLAHLADTEGVFRWISALLARSGPGHGTRQLAMTFGTAAVTTAVLSLDATVVLLTPIVLVAVSAAGLRPRPHVYACGHLANSASGLLPVSNLTNLLAFSASGLSFLAFTWLMALPWVVAIAVEFAVFTWFFRRDLAAAPRPNETVDVPATPAFALGVLGTVLIGFGVGSAFGLAPAWIAGAGALVLAVRGLARRTTTGADVARHVSIGFLLFVLGLAVVVQAVTAHGLAAVLGDLLPRSNGLLALLAMAGVAALLAAVVNNLPATLVLLSALGPHPGAGIVLAMLLGVNIGPNLTLVGSLASLLWRRVLARHQVRAPLREFTALGVLTVPACLLAATCALSVVLP